MKHCLLFSIIASFALFFAACSDNIARFSLATTGILPIQTEKGDIVKGKDCRTYIFGFGLGNNQNRVSGAVAKALEEANKKGQPSEALTNVDVSYSSWSALIFGRNCFTAQGTPVNLKQ